MTDPETMELEAKVRLDGPDHLRKVERKLIDLGSRRIGRWRETDSFFDFPDRRLKADDSAMRLRERADVETDRTWYRLTLKGPRRPGRFKNRREIELPTDHPRQAADILRGLGLEMFFTYTKDRTSLEFDDCAVELDHVEPVGWFIEVEGPDEKTIHRVLDKLDLADRDTITTSYLAMVMEEGK